MAGIDLYRGGKEDARRNCALSPSIPETDADLWRRGLRSVMSRDLSDDLMNVRIQQRTRQQYLAIAKALPPQEKIEFALYSDGDLQRAEVFALDSVTAQELAPER